MIARFLTRIASHILSSQRKDPREAYRAKARQMYRDQGKPVPKVLRP
ncbi:hypothetical protein [Sphingopyxis bauzanensis]|nr:hypothetical protein [Sphingopyxis bauzanensis]